MEKSSWIERCESNLEDMLRVCCIGTYKAVNEMVGKQTAKNVSDACRILAEQDGKRNANAFHHYYKRGRQMMGKELGQNGQSSTRPRSTKEKRKKRKKSKILKDAVATDHFRKAFEEFYNQVQVAKLSGWKHTTREAVLEMTQLVIDLATA